MRTMHHDPALIALTQQGGGSIAPNVRQGDAIGFTPPGSIYEKMRGLNALVGSLDREIQTNVAPGSPFKAAWEAWYQGWQGYYGRYESPWSLGRVSAIIRTDELDRQTETYRSEYNSFQRDYARQLRADGTPVPGSITPPSVAPEPGAKATFGLPWWVWLGGGIALAGLGYATYLRVKEVQAKKRLIEERVLPRVLDRVAPGEGEGLAEIARARDAEPRRLRAAENKPISRDSNERVDGFKIWEERRFGTGRDCGCSHAPTERISGRAHRSR